MDSSEVDRFWYVKLGLIVVVAVVLRTAFLDQHSYWYDEAVTHEVIQSSTADLWQGKARDNGNPNLFLLAAKGWTSLVGDGPLALRGLSVLLGVLAVPLMALLGRRLVNPAVGLLAALFLAVSPLEIELSNEARAYALSHVLIILNTWLFVRWVQQGSRWDLLWYGITTALSCYTHYYAFLIPPAHVLALVSLRGIDRSLLEWFGAMLLAAVLWLPWLPVLLAQLATPGNIARYPDRWVFQFLATPVTFTLGRTFAWRDSPSWLVAVAALGTTITFLIPMLMGALNLRQRFPLVLLLAWLLIPVLIPLAVAILFKPIYSYRYAAVGLPALLLLAASGYLALNKRLQIALGLGLTLLTATSLTSYATAPLKDDWRSATPVILDNFDPGELVIFDTAIEVVSFQYYVDLLGRPVPPEILGIDAIPAEAEQFKGIRFQDGKRIDPIARPFNTEVMSHSKLCLVLCVPKIPVARYETIMQEQGFRLTEAHRFHRIDVMFFQKQ